jgi:acyl-CoA dehydrogenase
VNADERGLLLDAVSSVITRHQTPDLAAGASWDESLWAELAAGGFTTLGADDGEASFADAAAVVATVAGQAAAVPLAEQLLIAIPALQIAGLAIDVDAAAPLTLAFGSAQTVQSAQSGGKWQLTGTTRPSPWAGVCRTVLTHLDRFDGADGTHSPGGVAVVAADTVSIRPTPNLAGEPHGVIGYDSTPVIALATIDDEQSLRIQALPAFARSAQIVGSLRRILEMTIRYASEREQFGRPIFDFQLIRSGLAVMAGQVEAVEAAVTAAAESSPTSEEFVNLAAAAKVRAGMGVDAVVSSAHQIHGAIGMTREYPLQRHTRRCWAWRDEGGSPNYWAELLSHRLLDAGTDLWSAVARL